jgi:hypothetical protein
MPSDLPTNPASALRTLRLIGLSMAMAVTGFGLIAWFVDRPPSPAGDDGSLVLYLWIAIATSAVAAAMVVWRGKVVPLIERPAQDADWRVRAASLQTGLIVCWSLVEAAALFGVVTYFLAGLTLPGLLGVFMMWAALALTWPRPEWLAAGSGAGN